MKTTLSVMQETAAVRSTIMTAPTEDKDQILLAMADHLLAEADDILSANAEDVRAAEAHLSPVMLDRLRLDRERIRGMAEGIRTLVSLPDPAWEVIEDITRPNGLTIQKTRVPLGVIAVIYESRPNVTSDAAALCIKSGNAVILRSGRDAFFSSSAIVRALRHGCTDVGYPEALIGQVEDVTRQSSIDLMNGVGLVDLLIPRGGKGLIRTCTENAKVPCIETGTGICHLYIDESADIDMALHVIENAKTSRPSVCNAAEVCLIHKGIAARLLPRLREVLVEKRENEGKPPVELRLDSYCASLIDGTPATDEDFDTEFLDYILAVHAVDSADEAIAHIAAHSTHHSEAVITEDEAVAERFVRLIDSAAVYVNASTRFTDGGEFGLGCEMGISTQKLHARGPMGLRELCTYKYIVRGSGQIR